MPQAVVNIGVVGHVDHGKTTLVEKLSGIWTDTHSEEIRRGISIRLGYADASFYRCPSCKPPSCYTTSSTCPNCGSEAEFLRKVSFVDAPGHEMLMATMLSGAAIMDGALLVVAANEPCPQPQTREHLMALQIVEVKNLVVVQNKIELVSKDMVLKNFEELQEFLSKAGMAEVPIIPASAIHGANIDRLIQAIEEHIPTPERDISKPPRMYVARSFDVNRPGIPIEKLRGGVIGGSLLCGKFKVGDEVEIRPGIKGKDGRLQPLISEIVSLQAGEEQMDEAGPGGLVGVGTRLDPSLTKADSLVGSVAGLPGTLPDILDELQLDVNLMERMVGTKEELEVKPLVKGEQLMITIGTMTTVGIVTAVKKSTVDVKLKLPACADRGTRVAISRRVGGRWRLIGYGIIS